MSNTYTYRQRVHAHHNWDGRRTDVYLFLQEGPGEGITKQADMILREYDPSVVAPPSFSLEHTTAQSLMDQLWNCGFRPSEGTGSAGSLAATEKHLADMRAITFNKLGVPAP